MYKSKLYLVILSILFSCIQNQSSLIARPDFVNIPLSDSVYLINKSEKKIGFYYEDKFLNIIQVHLMPNLAQKIWINKELLLTQSNENQNFYLLEQGDSIEVGINSKGDAVFINMKDSKRNNELNLSREMNENTPYNFWKINQLMGKYFDKNYRKLDSIYKIDYQSKISFLNRYSLAHSISKKYENRIKDYLKTQLLANQLWLGTASKDRISTNYFNYLITLKNEVQYLTEDSIQPIYNRLKYVYLRFGLRNLLKKENLLDSIYANFKLEPESKNREEMLFYIVKNEIEKNRKSKKWFINDFLINNKNNDFQKYIKTTLENNELISKTGNSTILINSNSKKTDYKTLINSLKGKIIFIDVWASWCAPCRFEMPNSTILRIYFKNEDIVFLYFSIDEKIMDWQNANKEEKLDKYPFSFIVLNAQKNDFIKAFKITNIPRYIILGKDGKMINSNGLKPGDPQTKKLLSKLIKSEE